MISREWYKLQKVAAVPSLTQISVKMNNEDEMKFRVTMEYADAVLKLCPHVKLAHIDLVERGNTSEEAFWNMYFEYKLQDKFSTGKIVSQQQSQSIFDKYEEKYIEGN